MSLHTGKNYGENADKLVIGGELAINGGKLTKDGVEVELGGGASSVTSANITDATATGKAVLTATDAAHAREAIGAGTSSLTIGTTSTTAKAGNYAPAWADVSNKPSTFAPPAATSTVVRGVKQAEVTPLVSADDAVAAAGTTPTKAEYDAVVALANELKTKVNSLINNSRSAGQASDS